MISLKPIRHIVLATDHNDATLPLLKLLTEQGYYVELVSIDSQSAFSLNNAEIVIIDVYSKDLPTEFIADVKLRIADSIQLILLCPSTTSGRERLQTLRSGVSKCLQKPTSNNYLLSVLALPGEARHLKPVSVLFAGDNKVANQQIPELFGNQDFKVTLVAGPLKAIDGISCIEPDVLVVTSGCLVEITALEFIELLRGFEAYTSTPVIFISEDKQFRQQLISCDYNFVYCPDEPVKPGFLTNILLDNAHPQHKQGIKKNSQLSYVQQLEQEHQGIDKHACVSITDAAGTITYVNDRLCQISSYSRSELIGKDHRLFKSGQHSPKIYRDLWATITKGNVWQGTLCNKASGGQLLWMNASITPVVDSSGTISHYIAIMTDVSSLKMHQIALETLVESLAAPDTQKLLNNVTKAVAQIFNTDIAFVSQRHTEDSSCCSVLSFWDSNRWLENFDYAVADTPCAQVGPGEAAYFSNNVAKLFPRFNLLQRHGIKSYFAMPLESADGSFLGQLGIMHRQPFAKIYPFDQVLKIYAKQISLELDRRQAITALSKSEAKFRTLTSRLPGMVYTADTSWHPLQLAEKKSFFDHSREKLLAPTSTWLELIHPEDRSQVIKKSGEMADTGQDVFHEYRIMDGNGQWRWVSDHKHPRYNERGEFAGVEGIVLDVNDHKEATIQLTKQENQLVVAQKIAHMGSWSLDIATKKLDWSNEAFRLLGYEPGSIEPTLEAFSTHVHKEDQQGLTLHQLRDWSTTQPTREAEYRVHCGNDEYRYVHELTMAEFSDSNELTKLYGAIQDISEKRKAEIALRKACDEAGYANKAKSEFLACMSHELRTPMNSILGFSQLLEHEDDLTEDHRESIHEISKAGKHLLRLINDVLDLSKVEAGKLTVSLEPVSSHPVITECLSLMSQSAEKRHIRISRSDHPNTVVTADQVRLRQALLNLLSNAVKYNSEHGEVRIYTSQQANNSVRFIIEDNGSGIPNDMQSRVFEPFTRFASEASKTRGTGIGLAITKRLIELMNGSIGFESTPGEGSRFWIELKQDDLQRNGQPSPVSSEPPQLAQVCRAEKEYLILYIEDNPANMRLVELILSRRQDIQLICAPTPELGIEMAENNTPDLILLDINLPRMDGYQVFNHLKNIPAVRFVPVIAVTANALLKDVEKGRRAGFADYLTKPLNVEEFNVSIDKILKLNNMGY